WLQGELAHSDADFNLIMSQLRDRNLTTQPFSQYTASIVNFNYNFYKVRSGLGLNASFTSNRLDSYTGVNESFGVAVGGMKGFVDNKYMLNISWSANFADAGDSQSANAGFSFSATSGFSASVNLTYLTVKYPGSEFNEFTGFIEGRYNFGTKRKP
ncbi:MAG: hypothetical protein LOY03_04045, partial [Cyclobacteriaceae bacterium]|nr:hypothetical protein [Cyclobacteriaceae bacterium]